jgi:parvulin-like peptidyl-prolyl isomerase
MDEKKQVVEVNAAEPDPAKVAVELAAAREMQARMMWGVKRGVNAKDVASLKLLRGMNRKQRRGALAQAGKRTRAARKP